MVNPLFSINIELINSLSLSQCLPLTFFMFCFRSVKKHRPESSEPSCVSVKSDWSMDPPDNFSRQSGPKFR